MLILEKKSLKQNEIELSVLKVIFDQEQKEFSHGNIQQNNIMWTPEYHLDWTVIQIYVYI